MVLQTPLARNWSLEEDHYLLHGMRKWLPPTSEKERPRTRRKKVHKNALLLVAERLCWIGSRVLITLATVVAPLALLVLLVLWTGTPAWVPPVWSSTSFDYKQDHTSTRRRAATIHADHHHHEQEKEAFPPVVDLWPSQTVDPTLTHHALRSCIDDDRCQSHYQEGGEVSRVALVRTPGRIGRLLQEIVENVLTNQTTDVIELIPTSVVERHHHRYSKIVRIATLPLLLDVLDLTLQSAVSHQIVGLSDVLQVTKSVVQWHCRLSALADDSALLTIGAASMVAHPSESQKGLFWFLGVDEDESGGGGSISTKGLNEWMDPMAHRMLLRIDECTTVAMQVQQRSGVDLVQAVDVAIAEELKYCERPTGATAAAAAAKDTASTTSLLADIAALLLSVDDGDLYRDSSSLCRKFPEIEFCRDKHQEKAAFG